MKRAILVASALLFAACSGASAQINAYVDLGASKLTDSAGTTVLYGPTVGISGSIVNLKPAELSLDVRGASLDTGSFGFLASGARLESLALGPMFSFKVHNFRPYAEVLVGYARYSTGIRNTVDATTDSQEDFNGGIDYKLKGRFAWRVFEFGYKQYQALRGQFSPESYSSGIVYSLSSR